MTLPKTNFIFVQVLVSLVFLKKNMKKQSYYFYAYKIMYTHNITRHKYYYGSRQTSVLPQQDTKYWSSSSAVHRTLLEYGNEWFKKKYLQYTQRKNKRLKKKSSYTLFLM